MKARKVKGLDPDGSLERNARRIAAVRLGELSSLGSNALGSEALEPDAEEALHDARIAAKRLRYVLELTGPALGKPAADGARVARGIQDLLGEIHDCDVMLPRVREHAERLRAEDADAIGARGGSRRRDLDPTAVLEAPNLDRYRGLEALSIYLTARRRLLYRRFVREWGALERRGFGEALLAEVSPAARSREARPDGGAP